MNCRWSRLCRASHCCTSVLWWRSCPELIAQQGFWKLAVDNAMIAMDRLNYAIRRPSERLDTRHGHGSTWLLTKLQQTPVAGKADCGARVKMT